MTVIRPEQVFTVIRPGKTLSKAQKVGWGS